MKLTKQQAISWHMRMWIYIAKRIAKEKKVMAIADIKREFCDMNHIRVKHACFCCEYAYYNNREVWWKDNFNCAKGCPVIWGKNKLCACVDSGTEYYTILSHRNFSRKNGWKKQAKLAYKIAMLPERKDA